MKKQVLKRFLVTAGMIAVMAGSLGGCGDAGTNAEVSGTAQEADQSTVSEISGEEEDEASAETKTDQTKEEASKADDKAAGTSAETGETTEEASEAGGDGASAETGKTTEEASEAGDDETAAAAEEVPKSEQTGTAGSNIPLKDNLEEAEHQIQVAMQYKFEEIYGDKVFDARIYVDKIYTAEEEQEDPIKSYNLGPDEVAFIVKYELLPVQGADINELMIPDGEYDEESGWIKNMTRVGILRPNEGGEPAYQITDFGTGF